MAVHVSGLPMSEQATLIQGQLKQLSGLRSTCTATIINSFCISGEGFPGLASAGEVKASFFMRHSHSVGLAPAYFAPPK